MLLEPPPRCKGTKDRPLLASPCSAVTHLMGRGTSAGAGLPQGLKTEVFSANSPPAPARHLRPLEPGRPSVPAASLPPAVLPVSPGVMGTCSLHRHHRLARPHVWLVAVPAFPDIPFISSEAARFNSLHFGIKSGSHPESNLCLLEQAIVTFPIKM